MMQSIEVPHEHPNAEPVANPLDVYREALASAQDAEAKAADALEQSSKALAAAEARYGETDAEKDFIAAEKAGANHRRCAMKHKAAIARTDETRKVFASEQRSELMRQYSAAKVTASIGAFARAARPHLQRMAELERELYDEREAYMQRVRAHEDAAGRASTIADTLGTERYQGRVVQPSDGIELARCYLTAARDAVNRPALLDILTPLRPPVDGLGAPVVDHPDFRDANDLLTLIENETRNDNDR